MTEEQAELINKLAMSLDTCLPLVQTKAVKEKRDGEGERLRPVTWQQRADSFPKLVDQARAALEAAGDFRFHVAAERRRSGLRRIAVQRWEDDDGAVTWEADLPEGVIGEAP